jgi:hypothetical protein
MKMLVGLLSFALSFASLASTSESKVFNYDGSMNSVELLLKAEKTHTEHRTEYRQSTCQRTEIAGYRTVCTGSGPGYPGPRPGPGYPGPGYPGRSCYQQPIYRTVYYPCTITVDIPFEVKDFDVDARVIIDVTKLSTEMTPGEKFVVTLDGDALSITTVGSKKFLLMLTKQSNRATMNGSVKFMDALYAVELIEAAPILKALNLTKISMEKRILSFDMGPIENRANIAFSLKVLQKKIGSDIVLFNRELDSSEIVIGATGTGETSAVAADINIEKLGVDLGDGKFSLTAKAFFKANGTLMNPSQFTDLEASRTLLYKIR